jgi:hypothetical protein
MSSPLPPSVRCCVRMAGRTCAPTARCNRKLDLASNSALHSPEQRWTRRGRGPRVSSQVSRDACRPDAMVQKRISRILEEPSAMKSVKHDYLTCVCVCRERERERESTREQESVSLGYVCVCACARVCTALSKHGLGFRVWGLGFRV